MFSFNHYLLNYIIRVSLVFLFWSAVTLLPAQNKNTYTLHIENKNFTEVLDILQDVYHRSFVYSPADIPRSHRYTFKITDADIDQALQYLIRETTLEYTHKDSYIIFKTRNIEHITIEGIVTDEHGLPLAGVHVMPVHTLQGSVTNERGRFHATISAREPVRFSYLGYKPRTLPASTKEWTVQLEPKSQEMAEVVVTALGICRKERSLSYKVQTLHSSDINNNKDPHFMNTLSGKIAGTVINSSAAGPGAATRVVMRGLKSFRDDQNILYVVDGIPLYSENKGTTSGVYSLQPRGESISDINPEDIETISVLTGPSATALYGYAAANGAILLTLKKAPKGKIRVSITNNTYFSEPFKMHRFQNEYANRPGEFKSWGDKTTTPGYSPDDFFQKGSGVISNIALSMGSETNQTYLSMGSTHSSGTITNSNYTRYNIFLQNNSRFLDDKIYLDAYGGYIKQSDRNLMAQGEYYNPLIPVYLYPRGENFEEMHTFEKWDDQRNIYSQNWDWGTRGLNMQNPYWTAKRNLYGTKKDRYLLCLSLNYDPLDWLNIQGRLRLDHSHSDFERKNYATSNPLFAGEKGFYELSKSINKQTYADFHTQVHKKTGAFDLSALLGTSIMYVSDEMEGAQGALRDIPNVFNYFNIDFANGRDAYAKQSGWKEETQSLFFRGEIAWKNKCFLNFTLRNDWSSALAQTDQLSFAYPSIGFSGIISDLVNLPEAVSYMQVKTSYAAAGSPIPRHLSQRGYTYRPGTGNWETNTTRPPDRINPERTHSYEGSLVTRLFNNLIQLDITAYRSNTLNQFIKVPISPSGGYDHMYAQGGNILNRGVELMATIQKQSSDFDWSTTLNYSYNRNKIISLLDNYYDPVTQKHYTIREMRKGDILLKPGGSMGDLYITRILKRDSNGYIWVNPQTQNVAIEELKTPQKAGSVLPKAHLGWNSALRWKNWNLNLLFTARFGGIVLSQTQALLDEYGVSRKSFEARESGGIPVNNGLIDPEAYYSVAGGKNGDQSQYIYSATNVRLQELNIGYNLPESWFRNQCNIRLALTARNLWMIYCKAPFDPELTPSTGTFNQGIDYFMQPSQRQIGFSIRINL